MDLTRSGPKTVTLPLTCSGKGNTNEHIGKDGKDGTYNVDCGSHEQETPNFDVYQGLSRLRPTPFGHRSFIPCIIRLHLVVSFL